MVPKTTDEFPPPVNATFEPAPVTLMSTSLIVKPPDKRILPVFKTKSPLTLMTNEPPAGASKIRVPWFKFTLERSKTFSIAPPVMVLVELLK